MRLLEVRPERIYLMTNSSKEGDTIARLRNDLSQTKQFIAEAQKELKEAWGIVIRNPDVLGIEEMWNIRECLEGALDRLERAYE